MKNTVTIKDIAQKAGLSIATVSMVLNGKTGTRVSDETVRKVEAIAQEFHYVPNRNAQLLKGKQSLIIGLVIPDIMNSYYSEMTKGIIDEGSRNGYNVMLFNSNNQLTTETVAIETMLSVKVAGAIICGINESGEQEDKLLSRLVHSGIPLVKIDRGDALGSWPCVMIDNYQAAYEGVTYLLNKGHRKIALIGLKWNLNIMTERENGYRQAMKDFGLNVSEEMVYRVDLKNFMEAAHQVAEKILLHQAHYTAVFVIPGDWLAIECMRYWQEHGLRIPQDLSVLGFDGIYMGEVCEPALTTIEQPKYEMGREAFRLLNTYLNEEKESLPHPIQKVLTHRILSRSSVHELRK